MRASKVLIEAIKGFESCHLKAYKCPAGVWTIGWGHTKGVKEGQVITQAQADSLLDGDLLSFVTHVNKFGLRLTQGQFDALVDFAYNCGTGNLDKSTLLRKVRVNAPLAEIQAEFRRWNKGGGKILPGLVKRREWEAQRYGQV